MITRLVCALAAAFFISGVAASAQTAPVPLFVTTVTEPQAVTSRFEDRVLVRAMISGRELWFQLDTGLQGMELTKAAASDLSLTPGADGRVEANIRIGPMRAYNMPFTIDADDEHVDGTQIAGRIGAPFFLSSIVTLDFKNQTVTLSPRAAFVAPSVSSSVEAPISVLGHVPFVHAWFGDKRAAMLLDTGSGTTSLWDKFAKTIVLTVPSGDDTGNQMLGQEDAVASLVPYQADSLVIGGLEIRKVAVLLKHDQRVFDPGVYADGTLGRDILSNFAVTLDYVGSKAYFAY